MHQNKKYFIIIAIVAISGFYNCYPFVIDDPITSIAASEEMQEFTITPNILELHGDSIPFTISFKLPPKLIRKKYNYVGEFYYTIGNVNKARPGAPPYLGEFKVDTMKVNSEKLSRLKHPIIWRKKFMLAYQDTFKMGYLHMYGTVFKGSKSKRFGPIPLKSQGKSVLGVVTTCRLVKTPQKNIDSINGLKAYEAIKLATSRVDGQYKMAYSLLTKAPKTATNQFNQGLAYLLEGKNYEEAKKAFETAAQLAPKDAIIRYALAIVAARTDKDFIKYLKKVVALDPKLKIKARQDAEFFKYWENEAFLKLTD